MKYILFLLFASIESFSIVMLGLTLFRVRLKPSVFIKAIIISVILAVISQILNILHLESISPLIQLITVITYYKFAYVNGYLRSILMGVCGYLVFAVVQALFILITSYYGVIMLSELKPYTVKGEIVQFATFLIVLAVCLIIKKTNEGYSFIPEEVFSGKKIKYTNKLFIFIVSVSLILLSSVFHEFQSEKVMTLLIAFFVSVSIATFILLYISLKRDQEQSE